MLLRMYSLTRYWLCAAVAAFSPIIAPAAISSLVAVGGTLHSPSVAAAMPIDPDGSQLTVYDARAAVASSAPPVWLVQTRGYGHGVGMSQQGARARAAAGQTWQQIIGFYYPGAEQTTMANDRQLVRVLVNDEPNNVTLIAQWPTYAIVTSSRGPAVRIPVAAGASLRVADVGRSLTASITMPAGGGQPAVRRVAARAQLIQLKQASAWLVQDASLLGRSGERWPGSLQVAAVDGRTRVVNIVSFSAYLEGVVAAEIPAAWPAAALTAQAVAARTYAQTKLHGAATDASFQLYGDTRHQAYLGMADRHPATTAAVRSSAGVVLKHAGSLISAVYSASNGGATADASSVWGGFAPYLIASEDPFDTAYSVFRTAETLTATQLNVKLTSVAFNPVRISTQVNPVTRRVEQLVLHSFSGQQVRVNAEQLRGELGLGSNWIRIIPAVSPASD